MAEAVLIILACGRDEGGWTELAPKHLAPVEGVPLLIHTIGQLNALGYENVLVATDKEPIKAMDVNWFTPEPRRWPVETFLSTRSKWGSSQTIIMAGDTAFSDAAIRTVVSDLSHISVHGNRNEIFAVTFLGRWHAKIAAALEKAVEHASRSSSRYPGLLWHFYRALCGFHLHAHRFEKKYFREIDRSKDPTTDFDSVGRYEAWLKRTGDHG